MKFNHINLWVDCSSNLVMFSMCVVVKKCTIIVLNEYKNAVVTVSRADCNNIAVYKH